MKESFEVFITPEAFELMKTPSPETAKLLAALNRILKGITPSKRTGDYFDYGVEGSRVALSVYWARMPQNSHIVLLYEVAGSGIATMILASSFEKRLETALRFEMC